MRPIKPKVMRGWSRKGDLVLEYKAKDKKQIKTENGIALTRKRLKELQPTARAKKKTSIERTPSC